MIIVFPCYNEESRIDKKVFIDFLALNNDVSLLFVDDGSTDNSLAILKAVQEGFPNQVRIKSLQKNSGKAEAVRQGLLIAADFDFPLVGYADTDLATPLSELKRLALVLDRLPQKVILGSRVKLLGRNIIRNEVRHYFGRIFATVASIILKLGVYDTQCGAKFFKCKTELKEILAKPFLSKWVFDIEIMLRLMKTKKIDRKSTRLNSSHIPLSRMPSSA